MPTMEIRAGSPLADLCKTRKANLLPFSMNVRTSFRDQPFIFTVPSLTHKERLTRGSTAIERSVVVPAPISTFGGRSSLPIFGGLILIFGFTPRVGGVAG